MRSTIALAVVVLSIGFLSAAQAQRQIVAATSVPRAFGDSEFRLGPDDVIEVSVYQDKDVSVTVPVRPDGKISIPLIGEMVASGKTATELQKDIAQKFTQYYPNPAVTVVVKEVNSPKVSVVGEVNKPGVYKIQDRATVLDAIAMAGGFTTYAKKDKVGVIRVGPNGNQQYFKLNVENQIKGRKNEPFFVLPYDKIVIQ